MLEDFLFEIQCAEEIGAYKLADHLDQRLMRIATGDHKNIRTQIEKQYDASAGVKSVDFSPSQQKFIISADANIENKVKREIKNMAGPYSVSFKYSQKNIDQLMGTEQFDPLDSHLSKLNALSPDYIGLDEFDDMEPTDDELMNESEFPADNLSTDPNSMDQFLLEQAYKEVQKHLGR